MTSDERFVLCAFVKHNFKYTAVSHCRNVNIISFYKSTILNILQN